MRPTNLNKATNGEEKSIVMRVFETSLRSLFDSIITNRDLIKRLVIREFTSRFRGSMLGLSWAILTPILTAAAFAFVFSEVFQTRWPTSAAQSRFDFVLILLTGLGIHGMFVETASRASSLIISNSSYVTRVVFPLELLPLVALINAMITACISLGVVIIGNFVLNGSFYSTSFLLPLVMIPYVIILYAFTMFVAAVGVFFRDLNQLIALLVTLSMFLTPIFYPVDAVPAQFRTAMFLNPLTFIVEQARAVLLFGHTPNFFGLAAYFVAASMALAASYWLFQRLRRGFADVL